MHAGIWEENGSVADDGSAAEVKLEDGKGDVHGCPLLVTLHLCCIRYLVISGYAWNLLCSICESKDWQKALWEMCHHCLLGFVPLGRRWRSDNCVTCVIAEYYPGMRLLWKQCGFVERTHWSTFVSSIVSSSLCCLLCSIAFFVFIHGGLSPDAASLKPSLKVLGVFMRPGASLHSKSANGNIWQIKKVLFVRVICDKVLSRFLLFRASTDQCFGKQKEMALVSKRKLWAFKSSTDT